MTDADDRLRALFAQDEPPARDPAFSAAVMESLVRRRFLIDLGLLCGVSVLGAVALWAFWPVLQPFLEDTSQSLFPVAGLLALAAGVVLILGGRPGAAFGLRT